MIIMRKLRHCVKSVQICSYFCSEYWKTRTRNGSVFGHFLRSEGHFNSHQDVISREFYDIFSYVTFPTVNVNKNTWHWGKSGQIRSYFWSVFSSIPSRNHLFRMRENTDRKWLRIWTFLMQCRSHELFWSILAKTYYLVPIYRGKVSKFVPMNTMLRLWK